MIKLSQALRDLVNTAGDAGEWSEIIAGALGPGDRRLRCFKDANSQALDPSATGVEFLNVGLTGEMEIDPATGEILFLGNAASATIRIGADLSNGASSFIIAGNGHTIKGTLGLTGTGKDLMFSSSPTASSGIGFLDTVTMSPPAGLPPPTAPDTSAPTVSLSASSLTFSVPGTVNLASTASDNVAVERVDFVRNNIVFATDSASPYTASDTLDHTDNGTIQYMARAYDTSGNVASSTAVNVTVNIAPPVETPEAIPVGGKLTDISFTSIDTVNRTDVPVKFGHTFIAGTFPGANAAVDLRGSNGTLVTCQMDAKTFNDDGTVRFAIFTALIPSLLAGQTAVFDIIRRASPPAGVPATFSDFSGLNAQVFITDTGTAASGPVDAESYTADAAVAIAEGNFTTWLSGPISTEWIVRAKLKTAGGVEHPHLCVMFHICGFKGQAKAKIDYEIGNYWLKAMSAPTTAAFEDVSNIVQVYRASFKTGADTTYTRTTYGKVFLDLAQGVYTSNNTLKTGLANDATVYTAVVEFDGVTRNIAITGSAAQDYGAFYPQFATQTGGLGSAVSSDDLVGLNIRSATTGANSKVRILNYGTLFPALKTTKLSGNVTYTAQITVGATVYDISILGSAAHTFGHLCTLITSQLGGAAVCNPSAGAAPGFTLTNGATVTTIGTLLAANSPLMTNFMKIYRPIDGSEVVHHPRTRWKKTRWWGTEPKVHIAHNRAYLTATMAMPNYDPSVVGSTTDIDSDHASLFAMEDIGNVGLTNAGMANTGAARGIALLPKWQSVWAVNQGVKARQIMLDMADRAGAFPCYWRDYNTGHPINLDIWPYAAYTPSPSDAKNPTTNLTEKVPIIVLPSSMARLMNTADVAHHPDFYFMAYLATGDYFYLEGQLFHAVFTAIDDNPGVAYRDNRKGLVKAQQIRGQAWSLRTRGHALYIMPNDHPNRASLVYQMEQNKVWFEANMVNPSGAAYNSQGWAVHSYAFAYRGGRGVAPWQDDFFTQSIGRLVELGFDYNAIFMHKIKSPIGRMTSGPDYCWQGATTYEAMLCDVYQGPQYTTWAKVWEETVKILHPAALTATCGTQEMATALATTLNGMTGYPTDPMAGRPANLQPALAYAVTHGASGSGDAWLIFDNRASKPNYNLAPQWCIVPRN